MNLTHAARPGCIIVVTVGVALALAGTAPAQFATTQPTGEMQSRNEDYNRMLAQLNLTLPSLPAPSDDPNRPANVHRTANGRWADDRGRQVSRSPWGSWTNYDESKANPYPLPDPLLLKDGETVTDAATWWSRRRPEILADFQTEVYGKIPDDTPPVTWTVQIDPAAFGGKATVKTVTGHIDNSAYPAAKPSIRLTMYMPPDATGPVPMMVIVSPGSPTGARGPTTMPSAMQDVLSAGWGYATFDTASVQADNGAGLRSGIIGLTSKGAPRKPDDWGVLAAWSWGLSRTIDYLQTDKSVDAKHLAVEGHSRWGKGALVAAAYDQRWAACFASCSGEAGAKLSRRYSGETLDNVAGSGEYHWMAGNFIKYGGHWNNLPVDSHELMALVAPRVLFITGGTGDPWADPHGEFLAAVAAGPVYRLLGEKDLGTAQMPAPDVELISGEIGFRYHAGGHTDVLDWPTFLKFARREFNSPAARN
jgi:hypothetical protein